ncbi:MAG: hypothetical protein EOP52_03390 [Sphingobacteriales bacterium]|nr:MAG: hypothetical protein EOP52_03390 [Sphingobacteriales bacterium]
MHFRTKAVFCSNVYFRILCFLSLFVLWSAGFHARAQQLPVTTQRYTTDDGLCDNGVVQLVSDSNGFIWLATYNGLSRFDGFSFRNYYQTADPKGGLRSNWITDLVVDARGTLWASTEWGLCYHDAVTDSFHYLNPPDQIAVLYKAPLRLQGDLLWVAATDGLWCVDTRTHTLLPTPVHRLADPQCLLTDRKGRVFIGTRGNGLWVYTPDRRRVEKLSLAGLPDDTHYMGGLFCDHQIWLATDKGLLSVAPDLSGTLYADFEDPAQPPAQQLMTVTLYPVSTDSTLVCSSYDQRLYVFDLRRRTFTTRLVSNVGFKPIAGAPYQAAAVIQNQLWLTTLNGFYQIDVQRRSGARFPFPEAPHQADVPFIRTGIRVPQSRLLWLLTVYPVRLVLYNPQTAAIVSAHELSQDAPLNQLSLLPVRTGFATAVNDQLILWSAEGRRSRQWTLPEAATCLTSWNDTVLLAGTASGLLSIHLLSGKVTVLKASFKGTEAEDQSGPGSFMTTAIACDPVQHRCWVSSIKYGLFEVDLNAKTFLPIRQPTRHSYNARNRIAALSPDDSGNLWLGTMAGLSQYQPAANRFVNFLPAPAAAPNYTYKLCIDSQGVLWCRTNEGLFYKKPGTGVFGFYRLPLSSTNRNLWQQPIPYHSGVLLGYDGELMQLQVPDAHPKGTLPVLITECRTPQHTYFPNTTQSKLTLRTPENSATIAFTCPIYDRANEIKFEYRLLGRDDYFKPAPQPRQLLYTNLPGGDYTFEVRASLPQYQPGIARLQLHVIPPFRETVWARLLLLGAIAGALYGLYRYRYHQLRKEQQFRNQISRNLHDEMGATLSSINIYSEVGKRSNSDATTRQLFDRIYTSSAALQESVSDIIWYVNAKANSLQDVLLRLQDFATPLLEARNISYRFETDHEAPIPLPVRSREHLYLIFKEAINNSLKYAQPTFLEIRFVKEGSDIVCSIRDDGTGFDPATISRGNGLANMKERARMMHATINWQTAPGEGCEMTLRF